MIRTQIQLTTEQARLLREEARRSGQSMAEIIRRSVDDHLQRQSSTTPPLASKLSAGRVVGLFHSGRQDVAEKHDAYLDDAYRDEGHLV